MGEHTHASWGVCWLFPDFGTSWSNGISSANFMILLRIPRKLRSVQHPTAHDLTSLHFAGWRSFRRPEQTAAPSARPSEAAQPDVSGRDRSGAASTLPCPVGAFTPAPSARLALRNREQRSHRAARRNHRHHQYPRQTHAHSFPMAPERRLWRPLIRKSSRSALLFHSHRFRAKICDTRCLHARSRLTNEGQQRQQYEDSEWFDDGACTQRMRWRHRIQPGHGFGLGPGLGPGPGHDAAGRAGFWRGDRIADDSDPQRQLHDDPYQPLSQRAGISNE